MNKRLLVVFLMVPAFIKSCGLDDAMTAREKFYLDQNTDDYRPWADVPGGAPFLYSKKYSVVVALSVIAEEGQQPKDDSASSSPLQSKKTMPRPTESKTTSL